MKTLHLIYFSPTFSTKRIVRLIGKTAEMPIAEYNITQGLTKPFACNPDDLVVFGVPVYAGRVPSLAKQTLTQIKGCHTPAIIVAVYGNRHYDDALLELQQIVEANDFQVIGAAAFIARHSIFPQVAAGRPDAEDEQKIADFTKQCLQAYESKPTGVLKIKGNVPYKTPGKIPFVPTGNRRCNHCGTCVSACPTKSIPAEKPRQTNKKTCIACARCIAVCPQEARHFTGFLYKMVNHQFMKKCSERREPETFFSIE